MAKFKRQQGFTLTEVLIALVLGIFLIGIVLTIFASSQSTFRASTEVSRSQENTRFAFSFLTRNIRSAGYTNCSNDVSVRNFLNFDSDAYIPSIEHAVFGWEFGGTGIGQTYILDYQSLSDPFTAAELTTAQAANTAGAASWDSQFIRSATNVAPTAVNLPATIAGFEPIVGSDIIAASISTPLDIYVDDQPGQTGLLLPVVDIDGNTPAASNVETGEILKIADCSSIDIFQNTADISDAFISIADSGSPGNDLNASFRWQKSWGQDSTIYSVDTNIFFVGTGQGGIPSLYQYSSSCGINGDCGATAVELVEGVENMQVLYGQDSNGDGVVNSYVSADQVNNYANVKSVKIGLLVRSPDIGKATPIDNTLTYTLLDSTVIDPPNDNFLRYVSNSTIHLRNTGL